MGDSFLEPGAGQATCAAHRSEGVGAAGEVALVDLGGAEVFLVVEFAEFGGDLTRGEVELEGFACELHAGCERVVGELLEWWEGGAGLAVVEYDTAAGGMGGDEAEGRAKRLLGEVGHNAEPTEEGGGCGVEAGGVELLRERLPLEVDRGVGEVCGSGEVGAEQEFALPLLGGGVVDLEDAEGGVGIAVGEGIQAGAEQDVLGDSARDGLGEQVFRIAAARDQEGAEGDGEGPRLVGGVAAGCALQFRRVGAEDNGSDGVVEDERAGVVELVGGAAQGDLEGGARGAGGLHGCA